MVVTTEPKKAPYFRPEELRERIVRLHYLRTKSKSPQGALQTFADAVGAAHPTVSRWMNGHIDPCNSILGLAAMHKLRELEIAAGIENPIVPPDVTEVAAGL